MGGAYGIAASRDRHGTVQAKIDDDLRLASEAVNMTRRVIVGIRDEQDTRKLQGSHTTIITQASVRLLYLFSRARHHRPVHKRQRDGRDQNQRLSEIHAGYENQA